MNKIFFCLLVWNLQWLYASDGHLCSQEFRQKAKAENYFFDLDNIVLQPIGSFFYILDAKTAKVQQVQILEIEKHPENSHMNRIKYRSLPNTNVQTMTEDQFTSFYYAELHKPEVKKRELKFSLQERVEKANSMLRQVLSYYPTSYRVNENIEVRNPPWVKKELAVNLGSNLEKIDSFFKNSMQLNVPKKTVLVLGRGINLGPLIPNHSKSPYAFESDINLFQREMHSRIYMHDQAAFKNDLMDIGILAHERTHSVLMNSYPIVSILNRSQVISEFLADTTSFAYTGESQIGKKYNKNGQSIRTFTDSPFIEGSYTVEKRKTDFFYSSSSHRYYEKSLVLSQAMWNIKESIPNDKFPQFLARLINNLYMHELSFAYYIKKQSMFSTDIGIQEWNEILYVLAMIHKTSLEADFSQNIKQIQAELSNTVMYKLRIEVAVIEKMSAQLNMQDPMKDLDFAHANEMQKKDNTIINRAYAFASALWHGLLYSGVFYLFY